MICLVLYDDEQLDICFVTKTDGTLNTKRSFNLPQKELHAFMTSGKMGDVSDSDFNTLFGIIDSDGNGEVDFIEFASFMGDIKSNIEEYDNDGFDEHDA